MQRGDHDRVDDGDEDANRDTRGDRDDQEMDTLLPLVRFRVIWTLPRVSLHLVEPRYKV